jgi:hypothetical protein
MVTGMLEGCAAYALAMYGLPNPLDGSAAASCDEKASDYPRPAGPFAPVNLDDRSLREIGITRADIGCIASCRVRTQ